MHANRSPAAPRRGQMLEVLATTTLIQIIATAIMLALTPIAPRAALSFGVSSHFIGYQISLIYVFGAAGSAFTGLLVGRYGAVRVEQLAMGLFTLGLLGLATAHLALAALASAMIGIGYGVQNPASSQILSPITPPHRRNMIFSIKQAGVPVGGALASLCLPLVDRAIGWQHGLIALAILPVLLGLYLNRHARHGPATANKEVHWLRSVLADQKLALRPPFRALSLLSLLYSSVQLTVSTFVVLMLVEDRGWTLVSAAGIAALVQLAGAFGRVLWGMASDRARSGMAMLTAIGVICTAALAALWFAPTMPAALLVTLLCVLGATASGWNGVAMAEMARHCQPHEASRVTGAILVYTFLGVVIGPAAFAATYGVTGSYSHTFALFALVSALGCALALGSALRQRRPHTRFTPPPRA